MVPARTDEEMQQRIIQSIREILEFTGVHVLSVEFEEEGAALPPGFLPATRFARAEIEAKQ